MRLWWNGERPGNWCAFNREQKKKSQQFEKLLSFRLDLRDISTTGAFVNCNSCEFRNRKKRFRSVSGSTWDLWPTEKYPKREFNSKVWSAFGAALVACAITKSDDENSRWWFQFFNRLYLIFRLELEYAWIFYAWLDRRVQTMDQPTCVMWHSPRTTKINSKSFVFLSFLLLFSLTWNDSHDWWMNDMALRSQMIFRFCSFIHAYFGESLRLLLTQHELAWINSMRVWALHRHSSWIYTCLRFARTTKLAAILWEKFSRDNLNPFRTCDNVLCWIWTLTRDVDSSETSSFSAESFTFNIDYYLNFWGKWRLGVDAISQDIIYGFSHLTLGKHNLFKYSWFFSNKIRIDSMEFHWRNGAIGRKDNIDFS